MQARRTHDDDPLQPGEAPARRAAAWRTRAGILVLAAAAGTAAFAPISPVALTGTQPVSARDEPADRPAPQPSDERSQEPQAAPAPAPSDEPPALPAPAQEPGRPSEPAPMPDDCTWSEAGAPADENDRCALPEAPPAERRPGAPAPVPAPGDWSEAEPDGIPKTG